MSKTLVRIVTILNCCLLLVGIALFVFYATTRKAESVEADFADLFERCRVQIETGEPFDSSGLEDIAIPDEDRIYWRPGGEQNAWMKPDSLFYVAMASSTDQTGQTHHVCGVTIHSEETVLSEAAQALVLRWFLVRHTDLVLHGVYRRPRDPLDIPPALFLTYDKQEPNVRGCDVVSYIVLDREGTSLMGKVGEKDTPCESP